MEVEAAIPRLAWNGHAKHNPNNAHPITADNANHCTVISSEYDDMTTSDNSDSSIPPPLPTTLPPDYLNGTDCENISSGQQSDQTSHSKNGNFSAPSHDRVCHNVATSNTVTQAMALTNGDSGSDSGSEMNNGDELDVLEQLKSSSTSKLMQLQQVQLAKQNVAILQSGTVQDDDRQAEILRLRKVIHCACVQVIR